MDRIRVLIVDDHTVVRKGLVAILSEMPEIEVVGEASDGNEAVSEARRLMPQVVLMDVIMPNCDGVEATKTLQAEMPEIRIMMFTISHREEDLFAAITAGATGYLLKSEEAAELLTAIREVSRGGVIVSPPLAGRLLEEFAKQHSDTTLPLNNLSAREEDVLQQVALGSSNKQIAATLHISENTVKTHLRTIMEKLHLSNRSQATAYAVRSGLMRDDKPPNR